MAKKYERKKYKQRYVLYTVITAIVLCAVFLTMVVNLYVSAEDEAYENLHVQTKQIKDDINLQLISDRENLATMASFASKLYADGESYNIMFESFKPIGLIENIGILTPDNNFVTKAGSIDLSGSISFEEEKQKGSYISGRIKDLTRDNYEIIRSAVPINVDEKTVGILYGVIKLDKIGQKYREMAKEFDAQLFVYDKATGDLIIDTVHNELSNISFLKDREYNRDYSYEEIMANDKGFSSFASAYRDENLHLHYSTMEDIGWMIAMGRYDSQVFATTHTLSKTLLVVFIIMIFIITLYILVIMISTRKNSAVTACASEVRRELLETIDGQNNILDALTLVCNFTKSRSAIFFDTNGDDYNYISPEYQKNALSVEDKTYMKSELFRYALELYKQNGATVNVFCIKPNSHLLKTNPDFYEFLNKRKFKEISFSAVINRNNLVTILGVVNSKRGQLARMLAEKIMVCFSIALYNKNHLAKTEYAATTDALTGSLNRVAYKNDIVILDQEQNSDFSCVYIDVNGLHAINNNYGHAAGDEMLIFIANTLKEIFYGHKIYRMGGDEFVVFCKNTELDVVKKNISIFVEQLKPRDYHVATGMAFRTLNTNTEDMVKEAEKIMYAAKAKYYQNKELENADKVKDETYIQAQTGIDEIDATLSVLKEHYNGIYRVSLDTDRAKRVLMPAYLGYNENEEHFSKLFSKYVSESVQPDFQTDQ